MVLALDVHYREHLAKVVGVLFEWNSSQSQEISIDYVGEIKSYIPGEFYRRELPCLLKIIAKIDLSDIELIIIDGYVYIDNDYKYGLGGILWESLDGKIPIVGIAKTSFFRNKNTVKELLRGESRKPLFVSAIGCNVDEMIELIASMAGNYRVPNILKQLDTITKRV